MPLPLSGELTIPTDVPEVTLATRIMVVDGFAVCGGESVVTTNGSGDLNLGIAIATAFPQLTDVVSAVAWFGDVGNRIVVKTGAGVYGLSFVVRIYTANTGAVVASTAVRLSWIAIGTV